VIAINMSGIQIVSYLNEKKLTPFPHEFLKQ